MDWTTIIVTVIGAVVSIVTACIARSNSTITKKSNSKIELITEKIDSLAKRTDLQEAALKEIIGNFIDKAFSRWKANKGITEKEFRILEDNYSLYKQLCGNHHRDDEFRIISDDVKINGFIEE